MDTEWYLPLLKLMLLSRLADKREAMLIRQGKAHIHVPSSGHEALMAITYQLKTEDYLYPYYRGTHLMIGKGLCRKVIAQDFLAKASSSSQGRSMAAHCGSRELNIFPSAAPTASQCLPAVGTAWGQKLSHTKFITLCSIGDGATREGEFYEAICFAIEHKLPIIFLVEDNHYAISTRSESMLPFRLNIFNKKLFTKVNGSNVFEVYGIAQKIIQDLRSGKGPHILWCEVDRLESHTAGEDHNLYRSVAELNNMVDPINLFKNQLIEMGKITNEEYEKLQEEITYEILTIYKTAELEDEPDPLDIRTHLYASPLIQHDKFPFEVIKKTTKMTMVEAVNQALAKGLENYTNMIMLGQDIEDPKGGVFGFTKNLSTTYPGRVVNAPIAEATIIGTAVGLSAMGFLPVFEIQFIDFITPGFDQLVSQVSSLRWRSCSTWSCPMVLYAPYGAYLPAGGLWHSQSNEGWWAHIPGLRVAVPSTPNDVLDLFWAAFQDKDPSLILIPKHIFRKRISTINRPLIPFGHSQVIIAGTDVTLVCWGNTVELAEQAAEIAKTQGVSVEVLDLRTIVPCDWHQIENSLAKTGRLVVVHEDNQTCGFGSSIITHVLTNQEYFEYLYSPPQLVARKDIHVPFNPRLEYAVMPSLQEVLSAINKTMHNTL